MRSSVGDRISRESVDTKMFKRESLSLVQECSEPFASSTIQDSCKKQSHDKVGYGFDARKEVDVLQLYRMKESTSSTTSNGTQYQVSNNLAS